MARLATTISGAPTGARLTFSVVDPSGVPRGGASLGEAGGWIGRTGEIRIDDPTRTVSSQHARIEWDGQGFVVIDQSRNGTELNGERLVKGQRRRIVPGDALTFCGWRVVAQMPGASDAASVPAALPRFDLSLADLVGPAAPPPPPAPPAVMPAPQLGPRFSFAQATPPAPEPPPAAAAAPPEPPRASEAEGELLAAFWRGFGLLPATATPALMEELGRALREACAEAARFLQGADGPQRDNPLGRGTRGLREVLDDPRPRLAEPLRAALGEPMRREAALHEAVEQAATRMAESLSARAVQARLAASVRSTWPWRRRAELWRQFEALEGELREAAENRFRKDLAARMRGETRLLTWSGPREDDAP